MIAMTLKRKCSDAYFEMQHAEALREACAMTNRGATILEISRYLKDRGISGSNEFSMAFRILMR